MNPALRDLIRFLAEQAARDHLAGRKPVDVEATPAPLVVDVAEPAKIVQRKLRKKKGQ